MREEIARFDEKTERKRSAGKQRKKSLEEQHVQLVEKKRQLEMQAAQKNKDAADIEAQVSPVSWTSLPRSKVAGGVHGQRAHVLFSSSIIIQIRSIHAATHAELQRGEEAFKKIKDQVGKLPGRHTPCCNAASK